MPNDQITATNPPDGFTEALVAEPLYVRIPLDHHVLAAIPHAGVAAGKSQGALPPETARVVRVLRQLCESSGERNFMLYGTLHKILYLKFGKGTQQAFRKNCVYGARIGAAPVGRERQHIYVEIYIMREVSDPTKPAFYLDCYGAPTTVMTGNNLRPVTVRDPKSHAPEPYPSSSPEVLHLVGRSLFHFLEAAAQTITPNKAELFSAETREAIQNGDFRVSNIQWACYASVAAAPFLRILSAMLLPPSDMGEGHPTLAECLGFEFHRKTNKFNHRINSILLIKRQGKDDIAWSVDFYNKVVRIGQEKQGGTLAPEERALIEGSVRVDITAQSRGIRQLIGAAQSFVGKHSTLIAELPGMEFAEEFRAQQIDLTQRQLEFAVFVLSHREVGCKLVRSSFADYLIPMIFDKVVPLRRLVAFTLEGLRAMERSTDPVAAAWRKARSRRGRNWVQTLCHMTGLKKSKIYKDQKRFWARHKVDISIPYAFYRRFELLPSISLMTDTARDELKAARIAGNGEAVLHLLDDADASFFEQMKTLVGNPILQPPVLLPAKVLGEVEAHLPASVQPLSKGISAGATTKDSVRKFGRGPYWPRWMIGGLDSRASMFALRKALDNTNEQLRSAASRRQRKLLIQRAEGIVAMMHEKQDSIKKAKLTRRLKKYARPPGHRPPFKLKRPGTTDKK